jgi:hypothetical protein
MGLMNRLLRGMFGWLAGMLSEMLSERAVLRNARCDGGSAA